MFPKSSSHASFMTSEGRRLRCKGSHDQMVPPSTGTVSTRPMLPIRFEGRPFMKRSTLLAERSTSIRERTDSDWDVLHLGGMPQSRQLGIEHLLTRRLCD
jgi:hypothetical protein